LSPYFCCGSYGTHSQIIFGSHTKGALAWKKIKFHFDPLDITIFVQTDILSIYLHSGDIRIFGMPHNSELVTSIQDAAHSLSGNFSTKERD
jgi:hypothetical protein